MRLAAHLRSIAADAEEAGVDHIWMMDHLRQIPQVGAAWADMLEPLHRVGLAGRGPPLAQHIVVRLGVLVSPAFRYQPVVLAKQIATLDVLSEGRAMCGLGVGWLRRSTRPLGSTSPWSTGATRTSKTCCGRCRCCGERDHRASTARR